METGKSLYHPLDIPAIAIHLHPLSKSRESPHDTLRLQSQLHFNPLLCSLPSGGYR